MNYAQKLVALRGDKTQAEVANAIGVATSTLSMYEAGARKPSDSVKIKLAEYYGRSVQYIFFE